MSQELVDGVSLVGVDTEQVGDQVLGCDKKGLISNDVSLDF
jgi:hypothetical protein